MEGFSFPLKMHEIFPYGTCKDFRCCHHWMTRSNQITLQRKNWTRLTRSDNSKNFSNQITDSCDSKHVDYVQRIYLTTTTCTSFESGRTVRSTV